MEVEVIKEAIKQVIEEVGSDDDRLLLSKLMSKLELEGEPSDSKLNMSRLEEEEERIVKELKIVRRQNLITHCLLSLMIVLTAAWQISEVSIILKLKDGISHPFRSIGSMLKSVIKPRRPNGGNQDDTGGDGQSHNSLAATLLRTT
ncbi:hypothetical protein L1987_48976 [Smallanthus sonchifolius]|uniref:Uncharacterized protein n=1 Tax=Smallanthus sonchifolius TaxID=185202 RepID=A0ACB9FUC6_9ASTR|nr:hypothetical protein L1987_48976 [Smallanthus sonchifolius]